MELLLQQQELQELLTKTTTGVVSTYSGTTLESAAMYYIADENLNIYFHTRTNSEKYNNIKNNTTVTFVVYKENPALTLQIKGKAVIIEDVTEALDVFSKLLERTTKSGLTPPLLKLEQSEVALIKITPTWARFGNFSYDSQKDSPLEVLIQE